MALSPPGPFICSESEELDERPHVLFLTAARKSLGSCQLGDTMKARPKQFRYNLWLRDLALKQLQELGKRESQLRWSCRLIEWYAQAGRKHHFIGYEDFDRMTLRRCFDSSPIFFELFLIDGFSSREDNVCRHDRSSFFVNRLPKFPRKLSIARVVNSVKCQESCRRAQTVGIVPPSITISVPVM